jgi:hypothetical protein
MWFAALSSRYAESWFGPFVEKLLEGDPHVLRLLRRNPFPGSPPAVIRARYYRYRFATGEERRASGAWWTRELIGEYMNPVSLPTRASGEADAGLVM